MSSNTFRYKRVGDAFHGPVIRPIIPIEIHKKSSVVRQEVLLDTGADFCIFGAEVADMLDIAIEDGEPTVIVGVGGAKTNGYIHKIGITVPGFKVLNAWAFFSRDLNDMNPGILGQRCFFESYKVSFEYMKRLIVVRDK